MGYWEQFYGCIAHCIALVLCSFSERKCATKAVRTGSEAAIFARIVRPEEAEDLPVIHVEAYFVDGSRVSEAFDDRSYFDGM